MATKTENSPRQQLCFWDPLARKIHNSKREAESPEPQSKPFHFRNKIPPLSPTEPAVKRRERPRPAQMLTCWVVFFLQVLERCANHGDKMAVDLGRKGKKDPRPLFRNAEGPIGFYRGTLQSLGVRNAEGPAGFYQGIRWVWRAIAASKCWRCLQQCPE